MTVSTVYAPAITTGNGATRAFVAPWSFLSIASIGVVLFDTVANAQISPAPALNGSGTYDFTVAATQDSRTNEYTSATVTLNNAPPGNIIVSITRNTSQLQTTQFINAGPLPAAAIEVGLDAAILCAQEALQSAGRAAQAPIGEAALTTLPQASLRANGYLAFDAYGNPTISYGTTSSVVVSSAMTPVLGASTTAAALTLLGTENTGAINAAISAAVASEQTRAQGVESTLTTAASNASTAAAAASTLAGHAPFRNRLHNPGFEIQQRGTSFSITTGSLAYTADRWIVAPTGFTAGAALGVVTGYRCRNGVTISGALAAGNSVQLAQRIEAANSYDLVGQQVIVSFDTAYTVSAGATSFAVSLSYPTAADNWTGSTAIQSVSITPNSTPGSYTATFAALPAGVANGLRVAITATQATATGTLSWTVTAVQLEAGTVATALERRPLGVELALCQRYFLSSYPTGVAPGTAYSAWGGSVWGQTAGSQSWTTMRATPTTLTTYDTAGTAGKVSNTTSWTAGGTLTNINATQNGLTWYVASAFVGFHFTASADL